MNNLISYDEFSAILNKTIFEESKKDLLIKISEYPERYFGLFRPTNIKAKLLQNILQSHEIKFGKAFEIIIEKYFVINGFKPLNKNINNNSLSIDQLFMYNDDIIFIEQKVRDDHDSTKKRGQIDNFKRKYIELKKLYPDKKYINIIYFLDPDLKKNKNYYKSEIKNLKTLYKGDDFHLFYGDKLFKHFGFVEIWNNIIENLTKWKNSIPDLPDINFDLDSENTFNEIKDIEIKYYERIFGNYEKNNNILSIIFPKRKTIKLLYDYFDQRGKTDQKYKKLSNYLKDYWLRKNDNNSL